MPDLANLSDSQNEALRDLPSMLDEYQMAIERRVAAQENEARVRGRLNQLGYRIAGVQ